MARRGRKPAIRIDVGEHGVRRVDLAEVARRRKAAAERSAAAPPVEDTRVADIWGRAERREAARAGQTAYAVATAAARNMMEPRLRAAELQREARHGETNRDGSTVERVLRAGAGNARIDAQGVQRVLQNPLERLHSRVLLVVTKPGDRPDREMNDTLYAAGERFRRDWYLSGLGPPSAMNLNGTGGGSGDPSWITPSSERAASHRAMWRQACRVLTGEERRALGGVILDGRTVFDVGAEITGRRKKLLVLRITMGWLRSGLRALAVNYGLIKATDADILRAMSLSCGRAA
jgi:hypothetical protein